MALAVSAARDASLNLGSAAETRTPGAYSEGRCERQGPVRTTAPPAAEEDVLLGWNRAGKMPSHAAAEGTPCRKPSSRSRHDRDAPMRTTSEPVFDEGPLAQLALQPVR